MTEKIWNIGSREDDGSITKISEALGIGFPTACLLYGRGYKTPEEASSFIRLEAELLHDPFLMSDMNKAAIRLADAVANGEKIVIYGDYDVDGVTSVSLLCLYLSEKGGKVSYYIPNRVGEGYGVNPEAIKKLADEGNTLFVTVDTGITAHSEAEYCKSLGCDMIVTDHHECQSKLPDALAVVNPKRNDCPYPFKELAGVGVAFKLVTATEHVLRERRGVSTEGFLSDICRKYIDLVALGTVADVMPLRDENRLIVSMGISLMERAPRPGIKALLDAGDSGKANKKRKINSGVIGFTLAPRINAAGRISSASKAVELFLCKSIDGAAETARELCEINVRRQEEENKIADELRERISADPKLEESPVMVLEADGWNHGVIGIVSSRITEKYGKPSILISFDGDVGKGSGRSVKGLNLVDALAHCSDLLMKYGGHELAAGLTVKRENLDELKKRINEYALEHLGDGEPTSSLDIDCELYPKEITLRQAEELELLEPYGVNNPTPTFMCRSLEVCEIIPMGQGRHTKLILNSGGRSFAAVCFGTPPSDLDIFPRDIVDVAFRLDVNEFMGVRSEQILVRDIRLNDEEKKKAARRYGDYLTALEENTPLEAEWIPVRPDFVSLYLHLKRNLSHAGEIITLNSILHGLSSTPGQGGPMNYVKLRLILDILSETGIIELTADSGSEHGREAFFIKLANIETKVNLERSCLYKHLTNPERTILPE